MTAPNGQSFSGLLLLAITNVLRPQLAFFHSSARETDDEKEECGKIGKQMTKRVRILKRWNSQIESVAYL